MDYHGSFEGYMDSKFKFFTLCENPVVNIENQLVLEYLKEQDLNVVVYGDYFNYVEDSVLFMDELIIDLNSSNLVGEDMQKNFLGAMLMSNVLELDFDLSKKVAFDFVYLPHRQEVIKISGKTFVNDSASVTPDSTISALQAFKDTDVLILGGLDRGYDFSQLFKSIIASSVELVCVLPDLELDSYKDAEVKILKFDSIDDCLNYLKSTNYKNILFSPGAPSYNQFQNFYERGDKFKSLLK